MPVIAAHDIKKTFVMRLLFEGVSFEVGEHDKVGLVGVNGCGKTTLFRILTGEEQADEGGVYKSRESKIVTMAQSLTETDCTIYDATLSVFSDLIEAERDMEEINRKIDAADDPAELDRLVKRQNAIHESYEREGGLTYKSRVRSTLTGLGFSEAELSKKLSEMSGGQRNKVQLAAVLLSRANLLLLDEPTNHLDIDSVAWLEDFLRGYGGAFIVISHDRYFLDMVSNRTFELKNTHFYVNDGNYSRHMELMASEQEMLRRKFMNTQKEIKRIQGIVEQQVRWGQERNFITAASKQKQIERLKKTLVAPERETDSIHFHFAADEVGGNDVIIAENLQKSYEKPIFKNVFLHIRKGERVFLLGPNGCGKTTLLKILMQRERADGGTFSFGSRVKPAYYEQTMVSLDENATVLTEVWDDYPKLSHTQVRKALGAFLFRGDDVDKQVGMLSGGEKARIQLLKMMLSGANLLLLDEPTNHLDIASREALEGALEEHEGTMLVVTHDRYLVNRLADRILYMDENGLTEYIGGYDDFLAERSGKKRRDEEDEVDETPAEPVVENDYKAKKELKSALNRAMGEIKRAEDRITEAEAELSAINEKLARPDIASDYVKASELSRKADDVQVRIDTLYSEWEDAQEKLLVAQARCAKAGEEAE